MDVLSLRIELGIMRAYLRAYVQEALRTQTRGPGRPKSKDEWYSKKHALLVDLGHQMSNLFHKDPTAKSQTNEEIAEFLKWPKNIANNTGTKRIRVGETIRYFSQGLFPHLSRREYRVRAIEFLAAIGARRARVTENN
jgi:hypothetical protein